MQTQYRYKLAAIFAAVVLVVLGLAVLRPKVHAAPPSAGRNP